VRQILFIDGPARGRVISTPGDSPWFIFPIVKPPHLLMGSYPAESVEYETVTYNVSRIGFCERIIWVGSVAEPSNEDLIDALLTDNAKAAMAV
jgi:hypothetical protein